MTASRSFYAVRYIRLPDLLGELAIARAEGKYRSAIKTYKQINLLILDEWLLYPLKEAEARDLLEIAEGRYKKGSTIFCSQFDAAGWYPKIGGPTQRHAGGVVARSASSAKQNRKGRRRLRPDRPRFVHNRHSR